MPYLRQMTTQSDYQIRLSVDTVVFSYQRKKGICVLLFKRKQTPFAHRWSIPGRWLEKEEALERAARRAVANRLEIKLNYLEQLFTFGKLDRDPRGRAVSIAYYGLVKRQEAEEKGILDLPDQMAQWFGIDQLPDLGFDHLRIIEMAILRLRNRISEEPIAFELLDAKFPFSDLERVYASLSTEELDRRNFKKKAKALGVLEELDEFKTGDRGRPAKLFRFNKAKYFALKEKAWDFEL